MYTYTTLLRYSKPFWIRGYKTEPKSSQTNGNWTENQKPKKEKIRSNWIGPNNNNQNTLTHTHTYHLMKCAHRIECLIFSFIRFTIHWLLLLLRTGQNLSLLVLCGKSSSSTILYLEIVSNSLKSYSLRYFIIHVDAIFCTSACLCACIFVFHPYGKVKR